MNCARWPARRHQTDGRALTWLLVSLFLVCLAASLWFALPQPRTFTAAPDPAAKSLPADSAEAMAPAVRPEMPSSTPEKAVSEKTRPPLWQLRAPSALPAKERVAELDAAGFHGLTALHEGDAVRLPLLDGTMATGTVHLVQHETGGWLRVGGSLEAPLAGSFALGTNGREAGGLIQFPARRLAYEVVADSTRGLIMRERRLGDIVCLPLPRPDFEPEEAPAQASSAAQAIPPLLSSRSTATAVLYLDFDGEVVTDPSWNSGKTINAQASAATNPEITQIWQRVKEDFWPFDIDVTTDVSRYDNAPVGERMRCIITPTNTAAPGAGGVAYINSFSQAGGSSFSSTIPCWVFNSSVTGIAEAISHELGHTLGLRHDGRSSPAEEYYAGQGSGATGWAPIMGVGYYQSLVQWSKGEYLNANNSEDDLAIITKSANGFSYITDEAGGTLATAASLAVTGTVVDQPGVISQASDTDVFLFITAAGPVSIAANPASLSPNLDILLDLLDENGAVLASDNPTNSLPASVAANVPGGVYYLRVRGTGKDDPLATGYTAYASIGEYTLTGTIPGGRPEPTITSAGSATGEGNFPFSYQITATNSPTGYGLVGTLPPGLMFDSATGLISGTPPQEATAELTLEATNDHGTGTKPFTLTILPPVPPEITSAGLVPAAVGVAFHYQIVALHHPASYDLTGTLPSGLFFDGATGQISGTPSASGTFPLTMSATSVNGTDTDPLTLVVTNSVIALDAALETPGRSYTASGTIPWRGESVIAFDGVDAAQSGPINDNGVSVMETSVVGPAGISFHYRVDSEEGSDFLKFFIDGIEKLSVSGFADWTLFTTSIASGSHTLHWEYRKDAVGSASTDAAWIDTLTVGTVPPPTITSAGFAPSRVDVPFSYKIVATSNPNSYDLTGTLPAGVMFNASTGVISGTPMEGGVFSLTLSATNASGTGTKGLNILVESGVLDLTGALDRPELVWTTSGAATWMGQSAVTHDSVDAAAAANLADGQSAAMETDVEGPASLRFFWSVSSEQDDDYLSFSLDGVERLRISGEVAWQLKSLPIPLGTHRIAFCYRKNAHGSAGQDAAWVDEVSLFAREGLPGSDNFVGAQALAGTHVALTTSNLDATVETGENGVFGPSFGHSLWWTWTAPETGTVIVSTLGSTADTILAIYTGSTLDDLQLVAANDDASRRVKSSEVRFPAMAGQTYFITVAGFAAQAGHIPFDLHYVARGSYAGLIQPDGGADKVAGLLQLSLTSALGYSAKVTFEGVRYTVKGSLASGADSRPISRRNGLAALDFSLQTDLINGDDTVAGTLDAPGQAYHFIARRRIAVADISPLSPGSYPLLLEAATPGGPIAYGTGYGHAVVTARGDVRFSGVLGDGQKASQGGVLTLGQLWPCYLAPYRQGLGALAGEVTFEPTAANHFTGTLRWRVENPAGAFSDNVALSGSRYDRLAPPLVLPANAGNLQLLFTHRDAVAKPADFVATLTSTNQVLDLPAGFHLKLDTRSGSFSGFLPDPVTGARQSFGGVLNQFENRGAGLFKSATGHGRIELVPAP